MDKIYKLTILAKSEEEAKKEATEKQNASQILDIKEIGKVFEIVVIKKFNEVKTEEQDLCRCSSHAVTFRDEKKVKRCRNCRKRIRLKS